MVHEAQNSPVETNNSPQFWEIDFSRSLHMNAEELRNEWFFDHKLKKMAEFLETNDNSWIHPSIEKNWLIKYYSRIERNDEKLALLKNHSKKKAWVHEKTQDALKDGQPTLGQIKNLLNKSEITWDDLRLLGTHFHEKISAFLENTQKNNPDQHKVYMSDIGALRSKIKDWESIPPDLEALFKYVEKTSIEGIAKWSLDLKWKTLQEQIDIYSETGDQNTKSRILTYIYSENVEKKGYSIKFEWDEFCFKDSSGKIVKNEELTLITECFSTAEMKTFMEWHSSDEGEMYRNLKIPWIWDLKTITAMSTEESTKFLSEFTKTTGAKIAIPLLIWWFLFFWPWKWFKWIIGRLLTLGLWATLLTSAKEMWAGDWLNRIKGWINEGISNFLSEEFWITWKPLEWRWEKIYEKTHADLLELNKSKWEKKIPENELSELFTISFQTKVFREMNKSHLQAFRDGKHSIANIYWYPLEKSNWELYTKEEVQQFIKLLIENDKDSGARSWWALLTTYNFRWEAEEVELEGNSADPEELKLEAGTAASEGITLKASTATPEGVKLEASTADPERVKLEAGSAGPERVKLEANRVDAKPISDSHKSKKKWETRIPETWDSWENTNKKNSSLFSKKDETSWNVAEKKQKENNENPNPPEVVLPEITEEGIENDYINTSTSEWVENNTLKPDVQKERDEISTELKKFSFLEPLIKKSSIVATLEQIKSESNKKFFLEQLEIKAQELSRDKNHERQEVWIYIIGALNALQS